MGWLEDMVAGGHMNTYACRFHIKLKFRRGHTIGGEPIALPFGAWNCASVWKKGSRATSLPHNGTHAPTTPAPSHQPPALVDKGPAPWQGAPIDSCDQAWCALTQTQIPGEAFSKRQPGVNWAAVPDGISAHDQQELKQCGTRRLKNKK